MQKKLIRVGNSVALVIDKGSLRRLGIKKDSLLHVTIEGSRLVIERSKDDSASPEQIAAMRKATTIRTVVTLLRDLDARGMQNVDLEKLSNGARAGLIHGMASLGEPIDPITLVRLKKCLIRRNAFKESWKTTTRS